MKRLIINADDFGFTPDVNAGIVEAHVHGVLTSTTLMANGDAFEDAVSWARRTPSLDIGCHLVLVQGRSVLTGRPLPQTLRDVVVALASNRLNVYAELRAQIERILAVGIRPTHLDSHKHTHVAPPVFRSVVRLAHEFRIPYVRLPLDLSLPMPAASKSLLRRYYVRMARNLNVRMTDHFLGFRLTGHLTEHTLSVALGALPDGTTEFMCHPGYFRDDLAGAQTRLKQSRELELQALISPAIRDLLNEAGVRLSPFSEAFLP